jgi:hypothetical protein
MICTRAYTMIRPPANLGRRTELLGFLHAFRELLASPCTNRAEPNVSLHPPRVSRSRLPYKWKLKLRRGSLLLVLHRTFTSLINPHLCRFKAKRSVAFWRAEKIVTVSYCHEQHRSVLRSRPNRRLYVLMLPTHTED